MGGSAARLATVAWKESDGPCGKKKAPGIPALFSLPLRAVRWSVGYSSTAQAMVAFFSSLDVLIMAMQLASLQTLNRVLAVAEAMH